MKTSVTVSGMAEIEAAFADLHDLASGPIAYSVVGAGMRVIAAQMREDLKPQIQHVASEVGYRFVRDAGQHIVKGKVGVGVGKGLRSSGVSRRSRGVGISADTFHWWVLGSFRSGERFAKRRRGGGLRSGVRPQSRGILPPQQPGFAKQAQMKSQQRAKAAMQAAFNRAITKFAKRHA